MEFEKLKKVIAEVLSVDPDEITLDTTFTDDLGADSLDLFQVIMGLEEEFDIEIAPEKAESIKTVEEALEMIKNELNQMLTKDAFYTKAFFLSDVKIQQCIVVQKFDKYSEAETARAIILLSEQLLNFFQNGDKERIV